MPDDKFFTMTCSDNNIFQPNNKSYKLKTQRLSIARISNSLSLSLSIPLFVRSMLRLQSHLQCFSYSIDF